MTRWKLVGISSLINTWMKTVPLLFSISIPGDFFREASQTVTAVSRSERLIHANEVGRSDLVRKPRQTPTSIPEWREFKEPLGQYVTAQSAKLNTRSPNSSKFRCPETGLLNQYCVIKRQTKNETTTQIAHVCWVKKQDRLTTPAPPRRTWHFLGRLWMATLTTTKSLRECAKPCSTLDINKNIVLEGFKSQNCMTARHFGMLSENVIGTNFPDFPVDAVAV